MTTKLTHADKDRMLNELRTKVHTLEAALQAANAQLAALATPPARESIAAVERTLAEGQHACDKCEGTGEVQLPNGEYAKCFRCGGKGYLTARDVRRNDVYALHQNIAAMVSRGEVKKYLSHAEIKALPAAERAGKRIVEHNGWLVLL